MPINDTQLADLLQHADAQFTSPSAAPPNARRLVELAATRRRRRSAVRAASVSAVLVVIAAGYHWWPTPRAEVTRIDAAATDLETLSAKVAALQRQTDALLAGIDETGRPRLDLISALQQPREDDQPDLDQLRSELTTLEARAAANDAHMAWEIAWSRSGALRLELARQDASIDPQRAAESFRQIATTYAGTRWGDEAQQSLARYGTP